VTSEEKRAYHREYMRKYRAANPEKTRAQDSARKRSGRPNLAASKAWKAANPGKMAEYRKRYNDANPEKVAACARAYRERNAEKLTAARRAYYVENKQRIDDYGTRYREANREKIAARMKHWREANPEAAKARERKWRQDNPEKVRRRNRNWIDANPEKVVFQKRRRRALKAGAQGRHTEAEWIATLSKHDHSCAYCGSTGRLEADHVVPLSKGGTDSIDNIVPACKSCNCSKGGMSVEEFSAHRQRFPLMRDVESPQKGWS